MSSALFSRRKFFEAGTVAAAAAGVAAIPEQPSPDSRRKGAPAWIPSFRQAARKDFFYLSKMPICFWTP